MHPIDELIQDLTKLKGTMMSDAAQPDVNAIAKAAADMVKAELATGRKAMYAKLVPVLTHAASAGASAFLTALGLHFL